MGGAEVGAGADDALIPGLKWETPRPPTHSPQGVRSINPGTRPPDLEDPVEGDGYF